MSKITLLFFAFSLGICSFGFAQTGESQVDAKENEEDTTLIYVEKMPEFRGNLGAYLGENMHYPVSAQNAGIEGRVLVRFVIDKKGAVTQVRVEQGVDTALDAEAVRVVKGMPRWKPGTQDGKRVQVYYRLPIKFTLTSDEEGETANSKVDTALPVKPLPLPFADEMPKFEGDLSAYLKQHMNYPPAARKESKKGTVSVTFVVEADGSITGAKVSKSVSPALDAEALRIVNAMPRWTAGKQSGKPVAVYQVVEVVF